MAIILVVDDHPSIVRLLQKVLESDAHEILTAADGEEALQRIQEEHPSLVLLDVMLPKRDGYEVLAQVKADAATREIPVVMLTGRDQDLEIARGLQLGADCYLSKPFRPAEVLALARRLLG